MHMANAPTIVYVGSATTHASRSLIQYVSNFKQRLRENTHALVLEWVETVDGTRPEMFERDLDNIRMCHVLIALIDEPSIGLGMEIAEAIRHRKAVLCLHKKGVMPSRLLQAAYRAGFAEIRSYERPSEALEIAREFINSRAPQQRIGSFL